MSQRNENFISEISEYMIGGNFGEVTCILQNNNSKIKKNILCKVLVNCCDICTNGNKKDILNGKDVINLLNFILTNISKLDDTKALDIYLRTLYFVLQLFIKKRDNENILQLQRFICIKQLDPLHSDFKKVYKNLVCTLQNYIFNNFNKEDTNIMMLMSLSEMLIEILMPIENVNTVLKKYIYCCFSLYYNLNSNLHTYIDVNKNVCKLVLSRLENIDENILLSILQLNLNIVNSVPVCMESMAHLLKITSGGTCIETIPKLTVEVLQTFTLILCDFNSLPSEKQLCNIVNDCFFKLKQLAVYKCDSRNLLVMLICTILFNLNKTYKNIDLKLWQIKMTKDVEICFLKLINLLESLAETFKYPCKLADYQLEDNISNLYKLNIFKINFLQKSNISDERILICLEKILSLIDQLKIDSESWKTYWDQFATTVYNLSVVSYNMNLGQLFLPFFIKSYIRHGDTKNTINDTHVIKALTMLCACYTELKDHENVLFYSAISVLLFPVATNNLLKYWIKAKHESQDALLHEITLIDVISKYDGPLAKSLPSINETNSKRLLQAELDYYCTSWRHKPSMLNVLKQLKPLVDLNTFSKLIVTYWIHSIPLYYKELQTLIGDTLQDFNDNRKRNNNNNNLDEKLFESLLKYMLFKYAMHDTSKEISAAIAKNKALLETKKSQNNETDFEENEIYCLYDCLKMENHLKTMAHLTEFLKCMVFLSQSDCLKDKVDVLRELKICDILINVAFDFRLQNLTAEMMQCWCICLKMSELLNDRFNRFISISFILEYSNVESKDTKCMIAEAENVIKEFKDESPTDSYIKVMHYLNLTQHCLLISQFDEARKWFNTAKETLERNDNAFLKGRLDYFSAKFLTLPCDFYNFDHNYQSVAGLYLSFISICNDYRKQESNMFPFGTSYLNCIIMEVTIELCTLFCAIKLPRELYTYGKLIINCAMEQALPLRVAHVLYRLTISDLLSVKFDNWQSKLDGINNILCLKESSKMNTDSLSDEFQRMLLDCPTTTHTFQNSASSPKFFRKNVMLPEFIKHSPTCECFFCTSVEYQELILMKLNSEAALTIHRGEHDVSKKYYNIIKRIYDIFVSKSNIWQERIDATIKFNIGKYPKSKFDMIYCNSLLEYRDNCIRTNSLMEAANLNEQLERILREMPYCDMYMEDDMKMYKILFNMKPIIRIVSDDDVQTDIADSNARTPENRISTIVVKENISPMHMVVTPKRTIVKPSKFNLGSTSEVSPNKCSNLLLTVSATKKKDLQTNKKIQFEVYDDDDSVVIVPLTPPRQQMLKTATSLLKSKTAASIKKDKGNKLPAVKKHLFADENENDFEKRRTVKNKQTTNGNVKGTMDNNDEKLPRRSARNKRL